MACFPPRLTVLLALSLAAPPVFSSVPAAMAQTAPAAQPAIIYDMSRLPAPAQQMREAILAAAKSGNIEALRPLFANKNSAATRILPAGSKEDPIAYLKDLSADGQGREVLANLILILQAGAVKQTIDGKETYLWPYFAAVSPNGLSPAQLVQAYQLMSVDDLDTIREIGHYIYFRAGIGADGSWRFFLTGDESAAAQDKDGQDNAPAMPNRAGPLPLPDDSGDLPEE